MRKRSKQKTISIRMDQEEWIKEHHLNLSRFVQDKLDEEILKYKEPKEQA